MRPAPLHLGDISRKPPAAALWPLALARRARPFFLLLLLIYIAPFGFRIIMLYDSTIYIPGLCRCSRIGYDSDFLSLS